MTNIYMIGNSLTDQVYYDGFEALAESRGKTQNWGRHMIPGTPLDYLVQNSNSGFKEEPYGYYQNALSSYHWDAVTLQPFDRQLGDDLGAIDRILKPLESKSPNADVYIYAQWPLNDGSDWDTQWSRPYTGQWDGSYRSKAYYEQLTRELNNSEPLYSPFHMIPVGHVMYELNQRMEAGQVPGYNSITQVYSDGIHLNNVGSYIVANTFFATIYKESPIGLPVPVQYQPKSGSDKPLSDFLAGVIQDAVWDVVTTTPLAGVTAAGSATPLNIRNSGFPEAIQAQAYSQTLEATGGASSYRWDIASGALPNGLTLSSTGTIGGTPTATGAFNFTTRVTDANGGSTNKPFTLTIAPDYVPDITTTSLPNAALGSVYQQTLTATQGNGKVTWDVASGKLPAGVTLRSDGLLSGTPQAGGTYSFSVRAIDADATPDSDTQALSLTVGTPAANTILAAKTLSPITIDGKINESSWSLKNAPERTNIGTANNTVKFGTLWDSKYLYVAAQVNDSALRKDSTKLWDDDAIEVFIDSKHDRESVFNSDDRQIVVDLNGNLYEQGGRSSGIQKAVQKNTTGYTVELAVPWANLGLTPTENLTIGFDLANDDDDNGGGRDSQRVWQKADVRSLSPSQFGNLLLSGTTVGGTGGTGSTGAGGTSGTGGTGTGGASTGGSTTPAKQVAVTFENLNAGSYSSHAYADPSGYTFADLKPYPDKLQVYGTNSGYQSKVLHPNNWTHSIEVTKTGGGAFDLAKFDYAASVYNDNVDATVTGYAANGSTRSASFLTSTKQLQTLDLGWTGLDRVTIDFAGGSNAAYGALDNFVMASR